MLHFELMPDWMLPMIGCIVLFAVGVTLMKAYGRTKKDKERRLRRQRNLAHGRMWNWLMSRSRKNLLTYESSDD